MRNVVKNVMYVVVLFLTALVLPSFAQQTQPDTGTLTDSSRALQFQIGSNFTLTSFQGATFSYKQHFTSTEAFRIGLSMSLGGSNSDNSNNAFILDSLLNHMAANDNRKSYYVQLNTQYIWYLNPGQRFLLYTGAGPYIRYESTNSTAESTSYPPGLQPMKNGGESKATAWSPGLNGVLGVEWFASKNISLLAEYGLLFRYYWMKTETTTYNDVRQINPDAYFTIKNSVESKQSGWLLSDGGVKFGLTVYFR